MKMMPTVKTNINAITNMNVSRRPAGWPTSCRIWDGNWLTMLTKMMSDMPLPIPRCVISSPSHMMRAVPAVIVSTIDQARCAAM